VDAAAVAEVADVSRETLRMRPWKMKPEEFARFEEDTTEAGDRFAIEESSEALKVGVWLPRIDGGRVALVELEIGRNVLQEARRALRLFYLVLLVVLVVTGVIIARSLRWLVLRRLEGIHAGVARVGETADLSVRLPERRGDELDGLALGFNRMLDALEQARNLQERAEMEREQLREHLLHAKKMEAIGTLAGGIAHDFNNLITGFMGSIDLVRFGLDRADPAHEHLDRMEKSAQRASALVKQLLALGRSQAERRVPLHLADVVADCLRLAQSGLPGTIDLHFRNEAMDDRIVADLSQLQQVVMNLVTNASHAMADLPAGRITVTIAAVTLPDADEYPETALLPPGPYLRLAVADTGRGVPEDIQARIFDPFFTTKPVGSGSGLGLAIAHGFATKHHGSIGVRSAEGQGAVFTLHLPCPPEEPAPAPGYDRRPLRVMLVDDDLLVRATLGKGLARAGHVVTEAGNAHAALRLLKESPNGFDAIVTDQLMPGMTGLELMKRVSVTHPELPVVLISGYMTGLDAAEASGRPGVRLLRKPVSLDELDRAVRAAVPGS
jgi:signal transduction histidine kinase/CheY-like chemotaxis protein